MTAEDIIAIGDNQNDLPMFEVGGNIDCHGKR